MCSIFVLLAREKGQTQHCQAKPKLLVMKPQNGDEALTITKESIAIASEQEWLRTIKTREEGQIHQSQPQSRNIGDKFRTEKC